jgi:hypothetical protein
MQVKISYTTDIKDVPKEVANVLNTVKTDLQTVETVLNSTSTFLTTGGTGSLPKSQLSSVKEILQKVFVRITDCEVILDGYEKVLNPEQKNELQSG